MNKKNLIKIVTCLIFIVILFGMTACAKKDEKTIESSKSTEPYKILKKDDISIDKCKRYIYTVVVNYEAPKDELEGIADEIVKNAKTENVFSAIQVLMYDGEYAISGETMPTLGKYIYAPNGDFSKAMDVESGDYTKMKASNELKDVNWKLRPSEDVRKITSMYNELFKQKSEQNPNDIVGDAEIKEKVADIMGITIKDIEDAQDKLDSWIWQN